MRSTTFEIVSGKQHHAEYQRLRTRLGMMDCIATFCFVDGGLAQLEIMHRFKVTCEVRSEGIGVRVPVLIGFGLLLLLSFHSLSRLLGLRSLTLSQIGWIEFHSEHFQLGRGTSPINSEMCAVTS